MQVECSFFSPLLATALVLGGCGRVGFEAQRRDGAPTDAEVSAIDAPTGRDASLERDAALALDAALDPRAPLVHFPFDEGTGGQTRSLGRLPLRGTLGGGARWVAGRSGGAVLLAGSSSAIVVDYAPEIVVRGSVAVAAWYRVDTASTGRCAVIAIVAGPSDGTPAANAAWALRIDGDRFAWYHEHAAQQGVDVPGPAAPFDAWHHIVAVREDETLQLAFYVDGSFALRTEFAPRPEQGEASTFYIGSDVVGEECDVFARPITLDALAIYDRALDEAEVADLYARAPAP